MSDTTTRSPATPTPESCVRWWVDQQDPGQTSEELVGHRAVVVGWHQRVGASRVISRNPIEVGERGTGSTRTKGLPQLACGDHTQPVRVQIGELIEIVNRRTASSSPGRNRRVEPGDEPL